MKFLSRVFTALNLLPSIAATAWANSPTFRQSSTNWRHAARIAGSVVLAKVGDGLEVRRQPPGQPHHLDVAPSLPLQPPARRDLVEVAVDVELQHQARMVARPTRRRRPQHPRTPARPGPARRRMPRSPAPGSPPTPSRPGTPEAEPPDADPHPRRSASSTAPKPYRSTILSCFAVFTQPPPSAEIRCVGFRRDRCAASRLASEPIALAWVGRA